jgi:hypothetical protein
MSHFIILILRTICDPNPYYPLFLTTEQIDAAKSLDAALDQPSVQLFDPIHSLAYALMSTSRSEVAENQFHIPTSSFSYSLTSALILSSRRPRLYPNVSRSFRGSSAPQLFMKRQNTKMNIQMECWVCISDLLVSFGIYSFNFRFYNAVLKPMLTEGGNYPMTH